ncbi:MAG: hypothetical protein H0T46_02480 [Deltaproteobacteria bacterium]|nr:hypothetical protein [Deltaproteobacteria bacterium]
MSLDLDSALAELYQAPHATFVAERKRLAGELKAAGDKAGATAMGKRTRPNISAWVVNQLWWHARDAFSALLTAAERLREGDLTASAAHREALAKLRSRAAAILSDAGNAATEGTLRRVAQTLSALAASATWEPDAPGMLTEDRDPPGFDAAMLAPAVAGEGASDAQRVVALTEAAKKKAKAVAAAAVRARAADEFPPVDPPEEQEEEEEEEEEEDEEDEEKELVEREEELPAETPLAPDPKELAAQLKAAKATLTEREAAADDLREKLAAAKEAITEARRIVDALQAQLDD